MYSWNLKGKPKNPKTNFFALIWTWSKFPKYWWLFCVDRHKACRPSCRGCFLIKEQSCGIGWAKPLSPSSMGDTTGRRSFPLPCNHTHSNCTVILESSWHEGASFAQYGERHQSWQTAGLQAVRKKNVMEGEWGTVLFLPSLALLSADSFLFSQSQHSDLVCVVLRFVLDCSTSEHLLVYVQ